MGKIWLSGIALAIMGNAFGQSSIALYSAGRSLKDQGLTVRSWGSGTASETDELALEGTTSVRISTRNYFQGGTFYFANPVNLSTPYADKNEMLLISVRVADGGTMGGPSGGDNEGKGGSGNLGGGGKLGGGGGGNIPGPPAGGGPPPGAGGGRPGRGGRGGGAGNFGGGAAAEPTRAPLNDLRLIVTTTDGRKSEAYVPVNSIAAGKRGWRDLAIPLQAIVGLDRTNKEIKEVAISADATATIYIGEMKIISDSTPIEGRMNMADQNIPLGSELTLIGTANGGSSILKYAWDFDDKDGVGVDTEGQVITRKFRKPGTYTITLIVTDLYGLKTPFKTSVNITVNP